MKRSAKLFLIVFCVLAIPAMLLSLGSRDVYAADEMTVVGTVNADGDLVGDDGQTYYIGENEKGDELANQANKKFEVKGTVSEKEGAKTIMVTEFSEIK
ncbi:MAG: hypothetical protein JW821_01350 [Deltaproteobacteria bacterium]|nr:hypothetical protein [Deltaproteobacteria bacterium]